MRARFLAVAPLIFVVTLAAPAHAQLASGASPPSFEPSIFPDAGALADKLASLDPRRELKRALANGDTRVIGVCGYACVPAAYDEFGSGAMDRFGMRTVAGTTDAPTGPDVVRLNNVAWDYAGRYNRLLMKHFGHARVPRSKKSVES